MDAQKISLSALDVEWRRLEVIAQNLANMSSTRTEAGEVYHPMRLVSGPGSSFGALLGAGDPKGEPTGVHVVAIEETPDGLKRTYDPQHPHADPDGFVTTPNIDHASEMALMVKTSRIYEANLAAVRIAQGMYSKALEIGKQS
ncbi:MAG TPA: flagellar basal body rod protein FlgC [Hyphomonadaceae bacterium]|jgi:flagellar basal-body rod protein FlgC|nr:flagellar basal body rod protein FlgC [Hyphomonadaceae bacterium]